MAGRRSVLSNASPSPSTLKLSPARRSERGRRGGRRVERSWRRLGGVECMHACSGQNALQSSCREDGGEIKCKCTQRQYKLYWESGDVHWIWGGRGTLPSGGP
eukprot:2374096-Rhodomonas_salina.1